MVAESCDQPIEDRRGVALSHCCSHTLSIKVGSDFVDQVRGTGQTANAVDNPSRMIDGGLPVANFGRFLALALTRRAEPNNSPIGSAANPGPMKFSVDALNLALSDAVLRCRSAGRGAAFMLRIFILLSVVCVASLLSLIYGARYLIPALVVAAMILYELHGKLVATTDAGRSQN